MASEPAAPPPLRADHARAQLQHQPHHHQDHHQQQQQQRRPSLHGEQLVEHAGPRPDAAAASAGRAQRPLPTFERGHKIGEGAFSEVFHGRDRRTGESVAIKRVYLKDAAAGGG
jgi:serine/threonine protein kinase